MSITHETLINGIQFRNYNQFQPIITNALTQIYSGYDWHEKSGITGCFNGSTDYLTATLYFTKESYIKIVMWPQEPFTHISLVTPTVTKEVFTQPNTMDGSHRSEFFKMSIGKTACGIGVLVYGNSDTVINSRNTMSYNLYVGEITKLDGTTTQGCIYTADDGTLTIATDSGISVENAYSSTITNDRMAVLVPIVNSTTGDVFKDIYAMRYSPIQYNKMFIPDTDKKYLCGKNICIAD